MKILQELRPNVSGIWCVYKHLFLSEFHLMELYEKDLDYKYLEEAQRIHLLIDDLLSIDDIKQFKECPRCDEK